MPIRPLPNDPSLDHLRKQAKRLYRAVRAGDGDALAQLREFHPRAAETVAAFRLADAQLVIARAYGFPSWAKLKQHLADIAPFVWNPPPAGAAASSVEVFMRLACLTYAGWHPSNAGRAHRMLVDHPQLAQADVYTATAVGDVAAVRTMIDANPALVNATGGPLRWPLLLYACYSRMDIEGASRSTLEVARLLLSRGADPNSGFLLEGSYAFTALTGVFGRGEDWENQPPHPACDALARLLLDAGADPNDAQTLYNRHFRENDDHLHILFEYGLGRDKGGPWLSRLNDRRLTADALLISELCAAAEHGFLGRVQLLLEHGVDVNIAGLRNGRTPYQEALRAGRAEIAEYLLARDAKRIDLDPLEMFALACISGRRDEVRERLVNDPTLLDRLGHDGRVELLHRAVDAKQFDGIRLIVELGVDINGMIPGTGFDRAVLHNAAGWGGLDLVTFLIALGADPQLRDEPFRSTPIGWAFHNHQRDVVAYLMQFATIIDAVRCDGVEHAAALLRENPALANARDEGGTPLVFYLHPEMERLDEMVRLLRDYGADFNARNREGRTPLERALALGWVDVADKLRDAR
ncbi:MAG: ankyrin repeat domain-containing protein [Acidobacteriota bacterium]